MPTKTTILSANASVISFAQSSTIAEVISAVNDEIVRQAEGQSAHGWELYDAEAGLNVRVYRAKNKDDETYKYLHMDFTDGTALKLTAYENWNPMAHTGTNSAGYADAAENATINLNDRGNVYLFISPRWLALCIKQFSSSVILTANTSGVVGIFETARDIPDDTAENGLPPFILMNTAIAGDSNLTTLATYLLVRTKQGSTNQPGELSTVFGKTTTTPAYRLNQFTPNVPNAFSAKDWAITPYVHGQMNEIRGRIFGLKIFTLNKLFFMDKVAVKCDQDFMYDAEADEDTDHYVIPAGYQDNGQYNVRMLIPC